MTSVSDLQLSDVLFQSSYSTSTHSLLEDFYVPALSRAHTYDRATGYFSSSILALAPAVYSDFVDRGGRIRLLCSPQLSAEDADALAQLPLRSQPEPREVAKAALNELLSGSALQSAAVRSMRALLDANVLELQFLVPQYGSGIFHDKTGVFSDLAGNRVAFVGSANETAAAWSGFRNHEQVEVYRSWNPLDSERVEYHVDQFDELWNGTRRGLKLIPVGEAADLIRTSVPAEQIDIAFTDLKLAIEEAASPNPSLPLRDYQDEVLANWRAHGERGIVVFATGGGKTVTALEAVREWTSSGRPALILVPSELLHSQWTSEIRSWLPEAALLQAGAGHSRRRWLDLLGDFTAVSSGTLPRIVLSTYQTAVTPDFRARLSGGEHLLVVGDEVHVSGSPELRRLFDMSAGGRLGLSATPERFGDPVGTDALLQFFGYPLEPRFGIEEALERGVLVPYEYELLDCQLLDEEQDAWDELSLRIAQEIARNDGELSDRARLMLINRARISKSASNKAPIAHRVLQDHYQPGDRWLVYCNDLNHIADVKAAIEDLRLPVLEYHSYDSASHDATLDYFRTRGGVLLAVKCLDEGVDIPLINKAIILASSTNPREYIQRRGRVLRRSPGKYVAQLFDVMVMNEAGLPLAVSEVSRAIEFAASALNVEPLVYLENLSRQIARLDDAENLPFEEQLEGTP